MKVYTQVDIAVSIAEKTGVTPEVVREILKSLAIEVVKHLMAKETVHLEGLGTFTPSIYKRTFSNKQLKNQKEEITTKSVLVVNFRKANAFKEKVVRVRKEAKNGKVRG